MLIEDDDSFNLIQWFSSVSDTLSTFLKIAIEHKIRTLDESYHQNK
jgi:hypothetical protein